MFRSLLDKLFAFINSFRLNDYDEIADTLMDGLRKVLDEHDPTFDINVYFTEELDEEDNLTRKILWRLKKVSQE